MSRAWRTTADLAFLLLLVAGFYWQLTLSRLYTWLENPDQATQIRPWLDYESRELHAGRLPLWAPYEWAGQSLIGQVQPGLANPLNWPLFAMPLHDGHIPTQTLHWYWVLIHWLAAAFMYWLCRDLGAGEVAALTGAAAYALSGFLGHSDTPQFLMGAVWLPLILLFFARVGRGERVLASACWSGAALGAAFLGGHHNLPIYTSVVLGTLWVCLLATRWRDRSVWLAAALFGAAVFLIAAVQILPAVEYGRASLRWAGAPDALRWHDRIPYSVHAEYSLGARAIAGLVVPGLAHHAEPFIGSVVVSLALIGLWLGRRRWDVRMLAVVALGGLLLALGKDTPVERLAYRYIPMVEKARYPAMAIAVCQGGLAALAAVGLELWLRAKRPRRPAWFVAAYAAAICGFAAFCRIEARPTYLQPLWGVAVASIGLTLLLLWRRFPAPAILVLCLAEAVALPAPVQPRGGAGSYEHLMETQRDIADFLERQPGWFRVDLDEDVVPYNFGDWYGIEQFGSYTASMPTNVHALVGHPEAAKLFGVVYRVARRPSRPTQVEVFHSQSGLTVYRDPTVDTPLWIERPEGAACSGDRLRSERAPGHVRIEATAACPGLLVVGDPWFTGWRATIDGRRVRIQQYQGVIRAIPIEAGSHRVEFRYMPGSVWWGAVLTLLGLALAVWLGVTVH